MLWDCPALAGRGGYLQRALCFLTLRSFIAARCAALWAPGARRLWLLVVLPISEMTGMGPPEAMPCAMDALPALAIPAMATIAARFKRELRISISLVKCQSPDPQGFGIGPRLKASAADISPISQAPAAVVPALTAPGGELSVFDLAPAGPGSRVVFARHLSFASADRSTGQGSIWWDST